MMGNDLVCLVNQDKGLADPILEIHPIAIKAEKLSFPPSKLIEAIEDAKGYLAEKQG